jgi:TetR/AcrR family transcriptional regulator, cholesterol catabolism regulator
LGKTLKHIFKAKLTLVSLIKIPLSLRYPISDIYCLTSKKMIAEIKKSRRDYILEEAAKLFKERGYAATTMRDLAEKLDIKAASLYNHIASKEEILTEICFTFAHEYVSQLDKIDSMTVSAAQKIEAVIDLHVSMSTQDAAAIIITNYEWKHLPEPDLSTFKALRKRYEKQFLDIITEGVESKMLRDIDPQVVMFTILSALRWIPFWYREERGVSPDDLKRNIKALILNGLNVAADLSADAI